jgi:hypothetical protein
LNNGTCVPNGNSYTCVCPSNASGANCEKMNQSQGKRICHLLLFSLIVVL